MLCNKCSVLYYINKFHNLLDIIGIFKHKNSSSIKDSYINLLCAIYNYVTFELSYSVVRENSGTPGQNDLKFQYSRYKIQVRVYHIIIRSL